MWINSLGVNNFRSFDSLELNLQKGLNILVGENNVGKSTVVVALSKLLQSTQQEPQKIFIDDDLRYGKHKGPLGLSVKCRLGLDESEQIQLLDCLSQHPLPLGNKNKLHSVLAPHLESLELVFEWSDTVEHSYGKLGPMFVLNQWVSDQVRSGGSTRSFSSLIHELISSPKPLEQVLPNAELWESKGILMRVGELFTSHFKSFAEFRVRPSSSGRSNVLESLHGGETASVLLNLKNHRQVRLRKRYNIICAEFTSFFPRMEIEAVEAEPGSGIADVQFSEKGKDWAIPLDNVGAGVAELLILLTNLVGREGFIFVIEEPESHLHPQAKRRLHKLIRESATNNQVIVVTHDAYFVEPDSLNAVIRFSMTDQGTQIAFLPDNLPPKVRAQLKTAMKDPAKREILFARAALLVEDESHKNFILGCAEKLSCDLDSAGLSIVSFDGHDGYKPYAALTNAFYIPYLCFRDLDWGTPTDIPPEICRALGQELEDFLEAQGLGPLMEQAGKEVGANKARKAKWVGENITKDQIPPFFRDLIFDAVGMCQPSSD